jgi:heme/copper-type cytochrome/quinol oxidase subunit 2
MYKDIFIINNFRHSGIFEGVWAAFPTFIIICILIPSLILLYSFEDILNPKLSIKVIGNQWYWTYEFDNWIQYKKINNNENLLNKNIEEKNIYTNYSFDSVIIPQDNLIFGTKRLLEVDNRLVLPTNVTTRFLVSSSDVLHAFAVPELGFKVDAVPGRLNQILLFISRPGVYYGQCSELCGANHAFMPIVIQAVMPNKYLSYIESLHLKTDFRNNQ